MLGTRITLSLGVAAFGLWFRSSWAAFDLVEDNAAGIPDFDHLFTPQRLAEIHEAAADVEAGNYFTSEQVREHLKNKRESAG